MTRAELADRLRTISSTVAANTLAWRFQRQGDPEALAVTKGRIPSRLKSMSPVGAGLRFLAQAQAALDGGYYDSWAERRRREMAAAV